MTRNQNNCLLMDLEESIRARKGCVIGVDEAGRGALAGPVVAAAFAFFPDFKEKKDETIVIEDSKKLTSKQREKAYDWLVRNCMGYQVVSINVSFINRKGITCAGVSAMRNSIQELTEKLGKKNNYFVLTDYYHISRIQGVESNNQYNIIHGDCVSESIAAASIIAKVYRDALMTGLSSCYPLYKWNINKGYATSFHKKAIIRYGYTKHHRKKFIDHFVGL